MPIRQPITGSSNIRLVEYDETKEELAVTFHSGKRYVYEHIPKLLVDRFLVAPSKGQFFNNHIKPLIGPKR